MNSYRFTFIYLRDTFIYVMGTAEGTRKALQALVLQFFNRVGSKRRKQVWKLMSDKLVCKCANYSALCGSHIPTSPLTRIQVPDVLFLSPFHLSISFWKLSECKNNQFLKTTSYLLLHKEQHLWCRQKEREQTKPFIFFHKSHIMTSFSCPFSFFPFPVPGESA